MNDRLTLCCGQQCSCADQKHEGRCGERHISESVVLKSNVSEGITRLSAVVTRLCV